MYIKLRMVGEDPSTAKTITDVLYVEPIIEPRKGGSYVLFSAKEFDGAQTITTNRIGDFEWQGVTYDFMEVFNRSV